MSTRYATSISLLFFMFSIVTSQERFDYPSANLSTTWVNAPGQRGAVDFTSGITVRAILLNSPSSSGTRYACGFHRNGTGGYVFAVVMVYVNGGGRITGVTGSPPAVWSANRNRLVGENATVSLTSQGDLALFDERGTRVWSSNTAGKGVVEMEMLGTGNLVLLNSTRGVVWQSFDSPTDSLVLGQPLRNGMKLTSAKSTQDPGESETFFLEMVNTSLVASLGLKNPQTYFSMLGAADQTPYAVLRNGSFAVTNGSDGGTVSRSFSTALQYQFLRLNPDGGLKIYKFDASWQQEEIGSLLDNRKCALPNICGRYGLCTTAESCSCSYVPSNAITQLNQRAPEDGCQLVNPLATCSNSSSEVADHYFVNLTQVEYFSLTDLPSLQVSAEDCKQRCSNNCSCKAAFYVARSSCYLLDELYTLRDVLRYPDVPELPTFALIKLQNVTVPPPAPTLQQGRGDTSKSVLIPVAVSAAVFFIIVIVAVMSVIVRRRFIRRREKEEELLLDAMPGVPRRFSYEELSAATKEFERKLGTGGFGSVFFGVLPDGTEVAVKRLESANQGQKEFRTEVITIGSVHHFNLVQLRGFCAQGDERLLVYEHVSNGSLDRWLFTNKNKVNGDEEDGEGTFLDWNLRLRIALGAARGLAYLHEECRERIIHLDVKPQNILLDEKFNAKVCDFGMSKLMNRDESFVFTTMRGTRGYMAPEWLQSSITEKVDVYSFGVVLLELVSGRKCLDMGRVDSSKRYLASWANEKVGKGEQNSLLEEMVDMQLQHMSADVEDFEKQVERVLQIAVSCIQEDPANRPSMSTVAQTLEAMLPSDLGQTKSDRSSNLDPLEFDDLALIQRT